MSITSQIWLCFFKYRRFTLYQKCLFSQASTLVQEGKKSMVCLIHYAIPLELHKGNAKQIRQLFHRLWGIPRCRQQQGISAIIHNPTSRLLITCKNGWNLSYLQPLQTQKRRQSCRQSCRGAGKPPWKSAVKMSVSSWLSMEWSRGDSNPWPPRCEG